MFGRQVLGESWSIWLGIFAVGGVTDAPRLVPTSIDWFGRDFMLGANLGNPRTRQKALAFCWMEMRT